MGNITYPWAVWGSGLKNGLGWIVSDYGVSLFLLTDLYDKAMIVSPDILNHVGVSVFRMNE